MDQGESALRQAFLNAVSECRRIGYNPSCFVQMLNERGAIHSARTLLNSSKTSEGFTELYMRGKRLDLSVEAIVLRPEHRSLFSPNELATARQRLLDVGYSVPDTEPDAGLVNFTQRDTSKDEKPTPTMRGNQILPPVSDAEGLVSRIKSVVGQPERNMEDVVKDLLVRLGHSVNSIVVEPGRGQVLQYEI